MTDLRKMGGKEHAPLLDKDSFLSPVTQAACAISQLSNDAFRKGEIVSIAEAEEIIKGYGLAPSEGMKPRCPKCGKRVSFMYGENMSDGRIRAMCENAVHWWDVYSVEEAVSQFFSPARSGEPQCKCGKRVFIDIAKQVGEQWRHFDGGSVACSQEIIRSAAPQLVSGDAPKVEEIARQNWTPCPICQSDYDGKFCHACRNIPTRPVNEITSKIMALMDATADHDAYFTSEEFQESLAAILRPYFPPASQTPDLNAENGRLSCLLQHIADTVGLLPSVTGLSTAAVKDHSVIWMAIRDLQECYKDAARARNGLYTKIEERWNEIATFLDEQGIPAFEPLQLNEPALAYTTLERVKMLATPASTARTDALLNLLRAADDVLAEQSLINQRFTQKQDALFAELMGWRDANGILAAPGSVPQTPDSPNKPHCQNCGCNHFRGENTLCNDGVPQAEPQKEEKL